MVLEYLMLVSVREAVTRGRKSGTVTSELSSLRRCLFIWAGRRKGNIPGLREFDNVLEVRLERHFLLRNHQSVLQSLNALKARVHEEAMGRRLGEGGPVVRAGPAPGALGGSSLTRGAWQPARVGPQFCWLHTFRGPSSVLAVEPQIPHC